MMSQNASEHISDEFLQMYLDGELTERRRLPLEGHLRSCETCSQRLAAWRDLFLQISELPDVALQRDMARAIEGVLAQRRESTIRGVLWLAEAASLLLLFTVAGHWIWRGWRQVFGMLPLNSARRWTVNLLSESAAVLRAIEEALASVGPALFPKLPAQLPLSTSSPWIWLGLIACALLWIVGNRLFLPRAAHSNGAGR